MTVTPATPPPSLEPAARVALLDAARECFANAGFHGTRLVDVAHRAGLTTGAFYGYFPSKVDVFHALFDRYVRDLSLSLTSAHSLGDYCSRWLAVSAAHSGTVAASEEITRGDPAFRAHRERCRQAWTAAAMVHLPSDTAPELRQSLARIAVDTLDHYWLTVLRRWSKVSPEVFAASLAVLLESGLYVSDFTAAPTPAGRPATTSAARRSWDWHAAPDRVEPRSARGKAQREAVLEAAADVFAEDGYKGAKIGDIAARAGVSAATVYRYFVDKRDVFFCLLGRVQADVGDVIYQQDRSGLGPDGHLLVFAAAVRTIEVRRKYAGVYRVWWELAGQGGELEQAWLTLRDGLRQSLNAVIAYGRTLEVVNELLDDEAVTEIAVDAFEGACHTRFDLGWDGDASDADLADTLTALLGTGPRQYSAGTP
jgi:AcrR family transcriptional regulator